MAQIRKVKNRPRRDGTQKTSYILDYVDAEGVRQRPQFDSRSSATAARDKMMAARFAGSSQLDCYLFEEASEDYLKICEKIGRDGRQPVDPETARDYRKCLENHVLKKIGQVDVANITPPDVVNFRDWLITESGAGNETIRKAFLHYKGVLQEAYNRGRIKTHAWGGVKLHLKELSAPASHHFDDEFGDVASKIPSRDEAAHLLDVARELRLDPRRLMGWDSEESAKRPWQKYSPSSGPRGWQEVQSAWQKYYVLILLALLTGLRQGEIRALKWESLKLGKGLLYVRHAASNGGRIKSPKTQAGYRVLDLSDVLVAELRGWYKICPKSELVFPTGTGKLESKSNLYQRCWRRLVVYAQVEGDYTFHGLRHYFASTMIAADFGPKEVQKEMGHADIQTTFNVYGHLFPEDRHKRRIAKQKLSDELISLSVSKAIMSSPPAVK